MNEPVVVPSAEMAPSSKEMPLNVVVVCIMSDIDLPTGGVGVL